MACSSAIYVPGETLAPTDEDIAELGPGSLKVEVAAYQWILINGGVHVRVLGTVVNNTGQSLQSVTLNGVLHDQNGSPIAFGSSYVYPAYLAPGAQGTFEFVGLNKRERGLKHTRLVTTASAQVAR
ncbi:MAG: FxLYD domain-containing protein [Deltaproteobacteria bacterium]|nr:FxLYD domain-containing protein [Deltaproteobacteria bacterium]